MKLKLMLGLGCFVGTMMTAPAAYAVDATAAQALAKKEGCLKCHGVDKKKDAKSFTEIGKKYAPKADGEAKLMAHLTSGEKVKMEDGTEEEHKVIKTKDVAEQKNLVAWVLSLGK